MPLVLAKFSFPYAGTFLSNSLLLASYCSLNLYPLNSNVLISWYTQSQPGKQQSFANNNLLYEPSNLAPVLKR